VLESIPKKDKKEIAEKLKDATNDEMNVQNLAAKLAHQSASRLGLSSWPPPMTGPSWLTALLAMELRSLMKDYHLPLLFVEKLNVFFIGHAGFGN